MAGRSRDTYKKRQKEVARAEKARDKAARRVERKLHKKEGGDVSDDNIDWSTDHLDDSLDVLEKDDVEESQPLHEVGPS
jgi:hypothetical protein